MNTRITVVLFIFLAFTVTLFAEVSLRITEPAHDTVISPCSDLTVKFEATATAGEQVKQIYLYYNGRSKGRIRNEPWEYTWKTIPKGVYELTARLDTEDGQTGLCVQGLYQSPAGESHI